MRIAVALQRLFIILPNSQKLTPRSTGGLSPKHSSGSSRSHRTAQELQLLLQPRCYSKVYLYHQVTGGIQDVGTLTIHTSASQLSVEELDSHPSQNNYEEEHKGKQCRYELEVVVEAPLHTRDSIVTCTSRFYSRTMIA